MDGDGEGGGEPEGEGGDTTGDHEDGASGELRHGGGDEERSGGDARGEREDVGGVSDAEILKPASAAGGPESVEICRLIGGNRANDEEG